MRVRSPIVALLVLAAGCSRPAAPLEGFGGATMGTTYRVDYAPAADAARAIRAGVDSLLEEIDRSMSTYDPDSVVSRLNASADTGAWHPVDVHFQTVFLRSREIASDTGGAFNPAVGPLVDAWGFGPEGAGELPASETIRELRALADLGTFEWRDSPPAVRKHAPEAALDFSAIAKGYGVDRIGEFLEERGVTAYFVEIGGEIRTRGMHPEGRPWRIGIERPVDGDGRNPLQAALSVTDAALATSGNYRNFTIQEGERVVHILDPATGRPAASPLLSVSVLAGDAMTADAYATAFMVMGVEPAATLIEARPGLDAYFISSGPDGGYIERRSTGFPVLEAP